MSAGTVSPGWIVVLNGPPRSGKSSIVDVIQETFDGLWLHLGVDVFSQFVTPPRLRPGIGLRPGGGERPDITGQPGREGRYRTSGPGGEVPEPVRRWQREVHRPGIYDLEIDISAVTPEIAAAMIRERLDGSAPTALRELAERG